MLLGNLIAYFLKIIYGAKYYRTHRDARIYLAKRIIPSFAAGQAWGNTIFVKNNSMKQGLVEHEYIHVKQWERHGSMFLFLYVWETIVAGIKHKSLRDAYYMNKFEVEARSHEEK